MIGASGSTGPQYQGYCLDLLFPFVGRRYVVTGGLTKSGGTQAVCEPLILGGSGTGVNTAMRAAITFGVAWMLWGLFHK